MPNPAEVFFTHWWEKCKKLIVEDGRLSVSLIDLEKGLKNHLQEPKNPLDIDIALIDMAGDFLESIQPYISELDYEIIGSAFHDTFEIGRERSDTKPKKWKNLAIREMESPKIDITETPRGLNRK